MAEAKPAQSSPYVAVKDCLWRMAVGLPIVLGLLLACIALGKFSPFVLLIPLGYGFDMTIAWGWILIRVLRGEKLINPTTLPIDNRLCDVELTVEKIRFGVSICWLLTLLALCNKMFDLTTALPFVALGVTFIVLRGLSLRRQLRAWRAVGGTVGARQRQRQAYGGSGIEEGQ